MTDKHCDFCSSELYKKQSVIEKDYVRVWYPLRSVIFGHFMIVTKKHIQTFTELTDEELVEIRELTANVFSAFKLNSLCDGYNILNNNLKEAGQHIPHTHVHLFMRRKGDVSPFNILSGNASRENLTKREWEDRVGKIRSWMVLD